MYNFGAAWSKYYGGFCKARSALSRLPSEHLKFSIHASSAFGHSVTVNCRFMCEELCVDAVLCVTMQCRANLSKEVQDSSSLVYIEPTVHTPAEKVVLFHQRWRQFGAKNADQVSGNSFECIVLPRMLISFVKHLSRSFSSRSSGYCHLRCQKRWRSMK